MKGTPSQTGKLEVGMKAPEFSLPDQDGRMWTLSELRGRKVIVYFYPADDTPGCTAEACDFRDARGAMDAAGYLVLGISPQDQSSHRAFIAKHELNFPLLVDADLSTARAYGSAADKRSFFKSIPLKTARSTFLIDEEGVITEAHYDVRARGHVAALTGSLGV